jgi:hypothetical protein
VKISGKTLIFVIEWVLLGMWLLDHHPWAYTVYFWFASVMALIGVFAIFVLDATCMRQIWDERGPFAVILIKNAIYIFSLYLIFTNGHQIFASVLACTSILVGILYWLRTLQYR